VLDEPREAGNGVDGTPAAEDRGRIGGDRGVCCRREVEDGAVDAAADRGGERIDGGCDRGLAATDVAQPRAQRLHGVVAEGSEAGDDRAAHRPAAIAERAQQLADAARTESDHAVDLLDARALGLGQRVVTTIQAAPPGIRSLP